VGTLKVLDAGDTFLIRRHRVGRWFYLAGIPSGSPRPVIIMVAADTRSIAARGNT
jgi:hypothetical protein